MLIDVPSSFKRPDGVWCHHIRQSDIIRFRMCPELHRRTLFREVEDFESDSAIVGTAAHSAYNAILAAHRDGWQLTPGEAFAGALEQLQELWQHPRLMQAKLSTLDEARTQLGVCLELFYNEALPWITENHEIVTLEHQFDIMVYKDTKREIYISGTWDLGCSDAVIDFKNSSSDKYSNAKLWQLQRYGVQPIIYTWADDMIYLQEMELNKTTLSFENDQELQPFWFVNMNPKKGKVDFLEIKVTVGDCKFMLVEMARMTDLIEAGLNRWPLGPTDWHCSPIWCPAWNDCRGKQLGEDPWGTLERRREELGLA